MLCVYRLAAGAVRSANDVALLDREHVGERTIVSLGPEQLAVLGRSQLSRDPQAVARPSHGAFQHPGRAEQRANGANVLRLSLEREHGRARSHAQPFHAGEGGDQLVRDAVAEILVLRLGARVDEREHRDAADARRGDHPRPGVRSLALQRRQELGDGREPVVGILGERAREHPLDTGGRVGPEGAQRSRRLRHLLRHGGPRAAAAQRRLASQHFVDHAREAVEVAPASQVLLAARLLRAHVFRRPQRQPALGHHFHPDRGERARDAEVGEHRVEVREQDVLGLHVAMDESLAMRVVECHAHVTRDPDRLREWHPPLALQSLAQRAVRHVRGHIVECAVGLAGVDERQDVGMGEARRDLDLPQEPLGADRSRELAPEHLDRDFAVVLLVLREVDGRHAAPTELAVNGIAVREGRGEGGVRFGHARGNMPAPRRKRE